jgi:thioredoxin 1
MAVVHFTKDNFEKEVLKAKEPVMVDFFAPWCGPCKMAGPVMDELAGEYKGKAVIGKVNVDEERELAGKYGVMSIPTVIIFKDGKEVEKKMGFPGKEGYQAMLDKIVN